MMQYYILTNIRIVGFLHTERMWLDTLIVLVGQFVIN